jgi:hypothetical protein
MTVGLLYDIGCKLARSCNKWNFLDEDILNQIVFGISVFHAFGHQWACQIVYHPHKCIGFGLTDGEGFFFFKSTIYYAVLVCSPWQTIQTRVQPTVYIVCKFRREIAAPMSPSQVDNEGGGEARLTGFR